MPKEKCVWCGSEKVVTSVSEVTDHEIKDIGWICKKCYDKIPLEEKAKKYLFGHEGFIDEEKTVWDR